MSTTSLAPVVLEPAIDTVQDGPVAKPSVDLEEQLWMVRAQLPDHHA